MRRTRSGRSAGTNVSPGTRHRLARRPARPVPRRVAAAGWRRRKCFSSTRSCGRRPPAARAWPARFPRGPAGARRCACRPLPRLVPVPRRRQVFHRTSPCRQPHADPPADALNVKAAGKEAFPARAARHATGSSARRQHAGEVPVSGRHAGRQGAVRLHGSRPAARRPCKACVVRRYHCDNYPYRVGSVAGGV